MIASARYDLADAEQRAAGIAAAVRFARRGRVVAFPVDYAYGIGTDAFSVDGVAALLKAKDRGRGAPTPILVPRVDTLDGIAVVSGAARDLAQAFWPGPLILLATPQPSLTWDLGAADRSAPIAVRMPLHPVALEILRQVGPMAVLGADVSELPEQVSVVLDHGELLDATSTVVDVTGAHPVLVREGAISLATLQDVNPLVTEGPPLH